MSPGVDSRQEGVRMSRAITIERTEHTAAELREFAADRPELTNWPSGTHKRTERERCDATAAEIRQSRAERSPHALSWG
jgi:hypothetical protein